MTKTDIFIKTYLGDIDFLEYNLKSIKKFATNYNEIVIVSDNLFRFEQYGLPIKFIHEPIRQYKTNYKYHSKGYFNQMLVKMNALNYCSTDRVFMLDSDMILKDYVDVGNLETIWFTRKWDNTLETDHEKTWKTSSELFYNQSTVDTMTSPGWIYTRHHMNCLKQWCQDTYNKSIEDYFKQCNIPISEFEIMGNFLHCIDKLDYKLVDVYSPEYEKYKFPIYQCWSYGGINQYKEELDSILSI